MSATSNWERVRELFHDALEQPAADRVAFVRRRCPDDLALQQEVESLLAVHPQADGFLSTPAQGIPNAALEAPRLAPGSRLGHFEIAALIGAGGMGEVYRALDTRLDRPVAIKVLTPALANDPRGRDRFEREARLISKLTHPHICTLHDVGSAMVGGVDARFLVMELVDGETLAARLQRGPMPVDQAMAAGIQIADALAAAHALGVIHRDLKPGNIMLTRSGVKLLDFGLARLRRTGDGNEPDAASDDTLTGAGAVVGTLAYMSPEQVRGGEADARSELFAFGAVLYEMLTGARAFTADSQPALVATILERDPPPLADRQPLAPAALDRLVSTCLAKNPDDRWQSARDLLRELKWVRDDQSAVRRSPRRARWLRPAAQTAAAALVVAGIAIPAVSFWTRPALVPARISFSIPAPPGTTFPRGAADMAVSPDGTRLAFVALSADGTQRLWIRRLDDVGVRQVDGTRDAHYPFWSPDGRSLGFFSHGELFRVDEGGGSRQVICEVRIPRGGSWGRDGTILFAADGVLQRVADSGGVPVRVTTLDESRQERAHAFPTLLPDGQRFLYLALGTAATTALYQGRFGSTSTERVAATDSHVVVVGTRLYSLVNRSMVVQDFDADQVRVIGEPRPVAVGVGRDVRISYAAMSAAAGTVAYRTVGDQSRLTWFDRHGNALKTFSERADYHHAWLSPDERSVAVERTDPATGRHTIWILDVDRNTTSRLVADPSGAHQPVWSPDGSRVLFGSNRFGNLDLFTIRQDGAGSESLVLRTNQVMQIPTDWSLDGRLILYDAERNENRDLWILPIAPAGSARPFLDSSAHELQGQFSPDVKWVAYTSNESGTYEVYVRRYPGGEGKWRVSTNGGAQPRWRRDGKELFYLATDGKLMAVATRADGATFETGAPQPLFDTGIVGAFVDRRNHYVVSRDGQRFLVNVTDEDDTRAPITVVVNWNAASKP